MELPPQERFTLEQVAERLDTNVSHVEEMVSACTFKYIIVQGPEVTHHVYFDQDLLRQHRPKQSVLLKEHKDRLIAKWQAVKEKPDSTVNEVYRKAAQREIDRIRKDVPEDHTYWRIGPNESNESAYLWQPSQPSEKWKRPKEVGIYIPRVALETFETEHKERQDSVPAPKAKKKDRSAALDPSKVDPNKLYGSAQTAHFLGCSKKYLQNSDILKDKLLAKKIEGSWRYPGQNIRNHMGKNTPEP